MTKLKLILFLFLGLFYKEVSVQNCTIKINDELDNLKMTFKEEMEVFLSIEFEINKSKIKTVNSNSLTIVPNKWGFDTVKYSHIYKGISHEDTFICKLRVDETYTISPCTCCGIFLMTPSKNVGRGYVKYINNSKRDFIALTSEIDYDTIPKNNKTDYISSSISMNCGFRPNTISIANIGYTDKKFDYDNWENKTKEEQELLKIEQQSHVVYSFDYLFLHKEKLILTIDKSGEKVDLKME